MVPKIRQVDGENVSENAIYTMRCYEISGCALVIDVSTKAVHSADQRKDPQRPARMSDAAKDLSISCSKSKSPAYIPLVYNSLTRLGVTVMKRNEAVPYCTAACLWYAAFMSLTTFATQSCDNAKRSLHTLQP